MADNSTFSVIIVVWNQLAYTRLCVEHMLKNTSMPFELVIVDNGSRPEIKEYCDSFKDKGNPEIVYIRNEKNAGPIRGINQGIKASRGDYICAIHNDVLILENGWLEKIAKAFASGPKIALIGLAGRQEIYNNGSVNEASLKHNLQNEDLNEPMEEEMADVAVLDGLFFAMRRSLLDRIGPLDESYGYMHCYDLDLSLRSISCGFRNVVVRIGALHISNGGITRKLKEYKELVSDDYGLLKRNCKILSKKWRHILPLKVT